MSVAYCPSAPVPPSRHSQPTDRGRRGPGPERAAEGEAFVENFRDQALVGTVPLVLVEYAYSFLLR